MKGDTVGEETRVVVITGLGGMGTAVARRLGCGSVVVLADVSSTVVGTVGRELRAEGYEIVEQPTDVSDAEAVAALADTASRLGRVGVVVHTAGLSPAQAPVNAILRVDLLGTALMLDAFAPVIAPGGAGVFIASMAGALAAQDPDFERRLATTPTESLLDLPELTAIVNQGHAYGIAKRANQVRVRAASLVWGRRRARVNTISPGIISTPMGAAELESASGDMMRGMIAASPMGRVGTPHDIAAAVEFLAGPHSTFVTGTDLLVDGGAVAALTAGPTSHAHDEESR
ncbi:SDR family oxidoreductase [Pseudofrankia sp. DC12]|uniref:SDR family oxidoreductase n=1 Tax=Pseudofrankia sp. DC12 TaxID=683315 RepID=UPI0005F78386|nr:SDR family oxidoreductase [Pseudofrankia sp. DC12]